jgi:hypothetical protein
MVGVISKTITLWIWQLSLRGGPAPKTVQGAVHTVIQMELGGLSSKTSPKPHRVVAK